MKRFMGISFAAFATVLMLSLPATAQRPGGGGEHPGGGEHAGGQGGHVGGGFVPQRGPAPGADRGGNRMDNRGGGDHRNFSDYSGHPEAPHVHDDGRWIGHGDGGAHYHLDRPWEHGHFPGRLGAQFVYRLHGGGPNRFFFNGFYFGVAPYDIGYVNGWNWDDDDVVLYDDPSDPGYYLAYNPRLGTYVHVLYMGQ